MPEPVVTVDHKFEGRCKLCNNRLVTGKMITGSDFVDIEGKPVCVDGSIGLGECGHTCESEGKSEVWFIEGKPVVRLGDPVRGNIVGKLIEGSDFVESD